MFFGLVIALLVWTASALSSQLYDQKVQNGSNGFPLRIARQAEDQMNPVTLIWEFAHPWENYLMPAPSAIALMGQLLVLSSKNDISLNACDPQKEFTYIAHPTSFRATMLQLTNQAWEAFHAGFRTMDYMQLEMQQVPHHVKTVIRVLKKSTPRMLVPMLDIPLNAMKESSLRCVARSIDTEAKFMQVVKLTSEISEALGAGSGHYEKLIHDNAIQAQEEQALRNASESRLARINQDLKNINEAVRRDEEAFTKALDEIPTGWKEVALNFAHTINEVIAEVVPNLIPGRPGSAPSGGSSHLSSGNFPSIIELPVALKKAVVRLRETTQGVKSGLEDVLAQNTVGDFQKYLQSNAVSVNTSLNSLTSIRDDVKGKRTIGTALKELLEFVTELRTETAKNHIDPAWMGVASELLENAENVYREQAARTADPSWDSTGSSASASGGRHANAKLKAELTLQKAMQSQTIQLQIAQLQMQRMQELGAILARIARLDMEKIQWEDLIKLIQEAVVFLTSLQEEWRQLTVFFTRMANRVESIVNNQILDFVKKVQTPAHILSYSATAEEVAEERYGIMEIAAENARSVLSGADYLHTLSSTYVEIHNAHFNKELAGLGKLMTIPVEEQNQKKTRLQLQAMAASSDIGDRVRRRRDNYQASATQRVYEAEAELLRLAGITTEIPSIRGRRSARIGITNL